MKTEIRTTEKKKQSMDMLHGSIADKLFYFAMPIGLMGLFEQLFNTADIFFLGHFVGTSAMAAVGNNMPVIGLLTTLLIGVSLGGNVVIAQYIGARQLDKMEKTVQTAILMSLGMGLLLAIIGQLIAYPMLQMLDVPPDVYDQASTYIRVFLLGLPFLSLYDFEAAIFRSCGDGKTPLYSLVVANILNIVLDFLSVRVFHWDLTGVVWGTVISFAVNAGMLLFLLCRTPDQIRLERHHMSLDPFEMKRILHIGVPAGLQGMVFALSNVLIQSSINGLGTSAMAASAAAILLEFNIYCFVNGFSQATTTFVGQNYGARNLRRCFEVTKVAFFVEAAFLLVVETPVMVFSHQLLSLINNDPEVIAFAVVRLYIVSGMVYLNGMIDILSGALRGYGYSLPPALVVMVGICSVRIIWLYTVFALRPDFMTLMLCYPISWALTLLVLVFVYRECRKYVIRDALHLQR